MSTSGVIGNLFSIRICMLTNAQGGTANESVESFQIVPIHLRATEPCERMRRRSSSWHLSTLALYDTLSLLMFLCLYLEDELLGIGVFYYNNAMCKTTEYLLNVFGTLSPWQKSRIGNITHNHAQDSHCFYIGAFHRRLLSVASSRDVYCAQDASNASRTSSHSSPL